MCYHWFKLVSLRLLSSWTLLLRRHTLAPVSTRNKTGAPFTATLSGWQNWADYGDLLSQLVCKAFLTSRIKLGNSWHCVDQLKDQQISLQSNSNVLSTYRKQLVPLLNCLVKPDMQGAILQVQKEESVVSAIKDTSRYMLEVMQKLVNWA